MSQWTIYYNPRCSTCRKTLELLRAKKIEPKIIEYLETPPNENELAALVSKLKIRPSEVLRKKEAIFEDLKLSLDDDAQVLQAMAKHPTLIQRPIVVKDDSAIIARPPETVLELVE